MNKLTQQMHTIDLLMGDAMKGLDKVKLKQQAPAGYSTTIDINGYEFDCIVDYEIEPACKGSRDEYGQQMEPDEPAVINMGLVWIFDGIWTITDIPEEAMTDVLAEILEHELG